MSEVQRWIAPDLNLPAVDQTLLDELQALDTEGYSEELDHRDGGEQPPALPTLEQIQAIEQAAHAEGHQRGLEDGRSEGHAEGLAAGHAEGLAAGQAEIRQLCAQIEGILDSFSRPLARLEDEVVQSLGALAVRVAGALVSRAYQADPGLLAALVQQALATVSASQRPLQVRLHPDDLDSIAVLLQLPPDCSLQPDPALARGDLRLHAESVRIDGSLQARLQAALSAVQLPQASQ